MSVVRHRTGLYSPRAAKAARLELYDDSYRKLVQVTPGSGSHLTQVAWRYEENSCREELQGVLSYSADEDALEEKMNFCLPTEPYLS